MNIILIIATCIWCMRRYDTLKQQLIKGVLVFLPLYMMITTPISLWIKQQGTTIDLWEHYMSGEGIVISLGIYMILAAVMTVILLTGRLIRHLKTKKEKKDLADWAAKHNSTD